MRAALVVALLCCLPAPAAEMPRARPPAQVYFEAEEFFSLQPVESKLEGFLGAGYRALGGRAAPSVIDKTVFLYGNPQRTTDYAVWVRAMTEGGTDWGIQP